MKNQTKKKEKEKPTSFLEDAVKLNSQKRDDPFFFP